MPSWPNVPDIVRELQRADRSGQLAPFKTQPDSAWKTLGDAELQQDFYCKLKTILPGLDSEGLTKAKGYALSNPMLAELSHQCEMDALVNAWLQCENASSHRALEGKQGDAVEALFHFCKASPELNKVAELMICELVCRTVVEFQPTRSKGQSMPAPELEESESLPAVPASSTGSCPGLPEWVRNMDATKLNLALQKACKKLKRPEPVVKDPVQAPENVKNTPAWVVTVSANKDGEQEEQYHENGKKTVATLLAKVRWLQFHEPDVYQEVESQLRASNQ
mmetsp:Transcript_52691/g.94980  ORF Transcript_52691/g.94980 Transcript_52691/m.94980 type:complete len:279 (+) Transcript_52691:93-929(+)